MNMFKSNGGFTLVELIVVIAILAILAGVAVPAYSGYISKAEEASDLTTLDSLKTAVVFTAMEKDPEHDVVVKKIVVTASSVAAYESEGASATALDYVDFAAIAPVFGANSFTFNSKNDTATWTASSGEWNLTKTAK